ncbi:MAG: DUF2201 family putative metallopeptidase [Candidatus Methanomethylicaceae archaeon]
MMSIEDVRREYDKLSSAITVVAPFISSLLRRVRIVLSRSVPTAGVNIRGIMVINPDFWCRLDHASKAWVLAHETMHVAFRDLKRRGERNPYFWNIVADGVNNSLQEEFLKLPSKLEGFVVTLRWIWGKLSDYISYDDLKSMSKEELYKLIPWQQLQLPTDLCVVDVSGEGAGELEGEVLQEGDPNIYEGDEGEDVDEKWKDAITKAYSAQKAVGKVPDGLKRLVDRLLKSEVDWRCLLRQAYKDGMGKTVVSTWRRLSRKGNSFPGIKRYTIPHVFCLVDTSSSISEEELTQFLTEIYAIAKQSPVNVVCFDAQAYDVIEARSQSQVINKVAEQLRGGGGTVIKGALEKTLRRMRPKDIVILFSDMDIRDWDNAETQKLLADVAAKSSVAVLASTHREVGFPRWHSVRLKVNHDK